MTSETPSPSARSPSKSPPAPPISSPRAHTRQLLVALSAALDPALSDSSSEPHSVPAVDNHTNKALRQIHWHTSEIQKMVARKEGLNESIQTKAWEIEDEEMLVYIVGREKRYVLLS